MNAYSTKPTTFSIECMVKLKQASIHSSSMFSSYEDPCH